MNPEPDDASDSDIEKRLDELLEPEASPAISESLPADDSRSSKPLMLLKTIVLSMDWELSDEILREFLHELNRLKTILKLDVIAVNCLQLLEAIGKYIQKKKAQTHPDSIRLLQSIYRDLEIILLSKGISEVAKRNILFDEVVQFKKLKEKLAVPSSSGKYDYLLNQKLINPGQLKLARTVSQKRRKSTEWVLIEDFNIQKKDIGKSLSLFYNCPFTSFDPMHPVPVDLISNLNKSFLLHDMWVPLKRGENNGIEILLDNPKDIRKTDHIQAVIKQPCIFWVGIKEDIEQYIQLFYTDVSANSSEYTKDTDIAIPHAETLHLQPGQQYLPPHEAFLFALDEIKKTIHTEFSALRTELKLWRKSQ